MLDMQRMMVVNVALDIEISNRFNKLLKLLKTARISFSLSVKRPTIPEFPKERSLGVPNEYHLHHS